MIPESYNIDFTNEYENLQERAVSRLLQQFKHSPVLLQILYAFVAEIQAFSTAVTNVMKYRTIYHATGENLLALGRIVGQVPMGWESVTLPIITEDDSLNFITEDGLDIINADIDRPTTNVDDASFRDLILLKIVCNFTKHSSVPEIVSAIYQATGVPVKITRSGPMQIVVSVPPDTDPTLVAYITRKFTNEFTDDVYIFPFPATIEVTTAFNLYIETESGFNILTEDGSANLITEDIPV